ncbi:MAG: type II toxin-antitoxin system Phd/YefM family antitoxin [Phormidesmis sp.]
MKSISKSKLKSKLLELLRFVESEGEEIVVTDRGKPVVKIMRYTNTLSTTELFGQMRGNVRYFEDLTAPTTDEWEET